MQHQSNNIVYPMLTVSKLLRLRKKSRIRKKIMDGKQSTKTQQDLLNPIARILITKINQVDIPQLVHPYVNNLFIKGVK
jgi:hypothetical protein